MVIILKGADFSANNVGKVEIYDEDTLKILSNYSKVQSKIVKNALNDFVIGLKESGIYTKISGLALPFLADNINDAVKNVFTGQPMFQNTPNVTLINKGIKAIAKGSQSDIQNIGILATTNMHWGVFCDEVSYNDGGSGQPYIVGKSNDDSDRPFIYGFGLNAGGLHNSENCIGFFSGEVSNTNSDYSLGKAAIWSTISSNEISVKGIDSRFNVKKNVGTLVDRIITGFNYPSTENDNWERGCQLFTFGQALTEDQSTIYVTLIKTLMEIVMK